MDVVSGSRPAPAAGGRAVSRPHIPAVLWYGFCSLLLTAVMVGVFRMIIWDGAMIMALPISVLVAFGVLLFLALRNLTAVAIIEPDAVELRRLFMRSWRLERKDILNSYSTPGLVEGRLRLHAVGFRTCVVPGFLVRGMRGTWVTQVRDARSREGIPGMTSVESEAFIEAAERAVVARDHGLGSTFEKRWRTWQAQDRHRHAVMGVAIVCSVLSLMFPLHRDVWSVDVLVFCVAIGVSVKAHARRLGFTVWCKQLGVVCTGLLPGIWLTRGQFRWQLLDPGLTTPALLVAGAIGMFVIVPPWRRVTWVNRARSAFIAALVFGGMAWWSYQMLAFANKGFDTARVTHVEIATVARVEEIAASRSTPATITLHMDGSPSFPAGLGARFTLYNLPAGHWRKAGSASCCCTRVCSTCAGCRSPAVVRPMRDETVRLPARPCR